MLNPKPIKAIMDTHTLIKDITLGHPAVAPLLPLRSLQGTPIIQQNWLIY